MVTKQFGWTEKQVKTWMHRCLRENRKHAVKRAERVENERQKCKEAQAHTEKVDIKVIEAEYR